MTAITDPHDHDFTDLWSYEGHTIQTCMYCGAHRSVPLPWLTVLLAKGEQASTGYRAGWNALIDRLIEEEEEHNDGESAVSRYYEGLRK